MLLIEMKCVTERLTLYVPLYNYAATTIIPQIGTDMP